MMAALWTLLDAAIWALIAVAIYAIVFSISRRYFPSATRHRLAASIVAVAVLLGAIWPFSNRIRGFAKVAVGDAVTPTVGDTIDDGPCRGRIGPAGQDIGTIDTSTTTEAGTTVVGWAVSPTGDGPAATLCAILDGTLLSASEMQYGLPRPDVAAAFQKPGLANVGFSVVIPRGDAANGVHTMTIVEKSGDAITIVGTKSVEIK
jgi:hypothetical protein